MKTVAIGLVVIMSLAVVALGQSNRDFFSRVSKIKLLESSRDDVWRILANYNAAESGDHYQRFYNDAVNILVYFSEGNCSDDSGEEDASLIWKVSEWKVTRVEVELDAAIQPAAIGIDLSKFTKEQIYRHSPDQQIYHDKVRGLAVETGEDGIETIIFFPPGGKAKKLCEGSTAAKEFYSRKSWFSKELEKRAGCNLVNLPANVEDVILSATEIEATTSKTISVTTLAVDADNDVLTYDYKVSAGQIVGNGAKVVWDLTGAKAGTYTIAVGVDDGVGIVGRTITKFVTVK